jgi:6-pyruvoyltetrahydropterin/6-carboxytetrahydropterin synthase
MPNYFSTKRYGHNIGLSAVFRQPNADHSHCSLLHGYSLAFKFTFACDELDNKNWAVDFGGLKPLKKWLEDSFDHKVVLTSTDPHMETFKDLEAKGLAELTIMDGVGAEKFAEHAWRYANELVKEMSDGRCWCVEAECAEHGANSAIYRG